MTFENKRLTGIVLTVVFLLSIPFFAIQLGGDVNWDGRDFLAMGILLLGTGLMCELVLRTVTKLQHRLIACGVLLFALFLVWAELAVGIFGSPFAGS